MSPASSKDLKSNGDLNDLSFEFVDGAEEDGLGAVTRSQLINRLAEHYPQLVAKDAEEAVKTILDAMSKALAEGQRIEIRGFGSFALSHRPSRVGRNPKSGAKVVVPPKRVPHFKPGKELRERVDHALQMAELAAGESASVK